MASWNAQRGTVLRELNKAVSIQRLFPDISFEFNKDEFAQLTQKFSKFPGAIEAATFEAVEKARKATRSEFIKSFNKLVTLEASYIRKGIKSKKARKTGTGVFSDISIVTGRIPLSRYEVKPANPPKLKGVPIKNRIRVRYRLRKAGGMHGDDPYSDQAPAGKKQFVARTKSGHIGVFFNKGDKRIQEDIGPALQYHAYASGFMEHIEKISRTTFKTAFLAEASAITRIK